MFDRFTHWVGSIFGDVKGDVENVVKAAVNAVTTLWHVLTNLGHNVVKAWAIFHRGVTELGHDVEGLAHVTWGKLHDIYDRLVPAAIRHAITAAARYAERIVARLESWAKAAIHAARVALSRAINDVRHWALGWINFLHKEINAAKATLAKIAHLVGTLLSAPSHLAKWVFGALVHEIVPWIEHNGEALGKALFRRGARVLIDSAHDIESVLADII